MKKRSDENSDIGQLDFQEIEKIETLPEIQQIISFIEQDQDFSEGIKQTLSLMQDQSLDPSEIYQIFLNLIMKYLQSSKHQVLHKKITITEDIELKLQQDIKNFISQSLEKIKAFNKSNQLDDLENTSESKKYLTRLLKLLAIYEIHKILNPKRLAGMTKKENFINNMLIGGIKRAEKYEGGKRKDLAKYSKNFIEKLATEHESIKPNLRKL